MRMMKINKGIQKGVVIAFFLGMLIAIFAPVVIQKNPINNGGDSIAIPATETIAISPSTSSTEQTCAPAVN